METTIMGFKDSTLTASFQVSVSWASPRHDGIDVRPGNHRPPEFVSVPISSIYSCDILEMMTLLSFPSPTCCPKTDLPACCMGVCFCIGLEIWQEWL